MSSDTGTSERKSHSLLLRKGSSNRIALKEKIVQIYEAFFQVQIYTMIIQFIKPSSRYKYTL